MPHEESQITGPTGQLFDQVESLSILSELSNQINQASGEADLMDILKVIMSRVTTTIEVEAIAIWTQEAGTDFLMIHSSQGLSDDYIRFFNNTDRVKTEKGLVGSVMKSRKSLHISNLDDYKKFGPDRWSNMLVKEGIKSILAAPLFVGNTNYGAFCIYDKKEHNFAPEEVLFTETLAHQVASLFENSQKTQLLKDEGLRYRLQRDELLSINRVVRKVDAHLYTATSESVDQLSQYISDTYDSTGIAILHNTSEHNDQLNLVGSHNLSAEHLQHIVENIQREESQLIHSLATQKEAVLAQRVFTHELISKTWATVLAKDHITSLTAIPLVAKDHLVGVFLIFYDDLHVTSEDELSVLNTFAQFLSVSLENMKIFSSLSTQKQRNESMIHSLRDGIIVFDLNGNIISINPRTEELLDVKESVLRTIDFDESLRASYRHISPVWEEAIEDYETKEITVQHSRKRILQVTQVPLKDNELKPMGSMRVLHDITDEQLVQEMKTNFISTATHQLRTPLTGIRWGLSMLHSNEIGTLNAEQVKIVEKLLTTNNFVISLVNNLLNIQKIESDDSVHVAEPTNIHLLLRSITEESKITLQEKNITLNQHYETDIPSIMADQNEMLIALQNIFDNAVKYTPAGGSVTITTAHDTKNLTVSVADTGIGISADDQKLLFSKFFRAKNAVLVETDGSGLGLYLSKKIIEAHKGSIALTSTLGKGTTFTVTLPIKSGGS